MVGTMLSPPNRQGFGVKAKKNLGTGLGSSLPKGSIKILYLPVMEVNFTSYPQNPGQPCEIILVPYQLDATGIPMS